MKQKTRLSGGFFEIRDKKKMEEKWCACGAIDFNKPSLVREGFASVRSTLAGVAEKRKVARLTAPERGQSKRSEKPPL